MHRDLRPIVAEIETVFRHLRVPPRGATLAAPPLEAALDLAKCVQDLSPAEWRAAARNLAEAFHGPVFGHGESWKKLPSEPFATMDRQTLQRRERREARLSRKAAA